MRDILTDFSDVAEVLLKRRGYSETQGAWTFRDSKLTLRRVWRKNPKVEDATIVDFLKNGKLPHNLPS